MDINTAKDIIRAAALADDTVIMEGVHGIGKSDIAKQIQNEDGYHLETLFLSHQETGDLIGIPHIIVQDGVSLTTWSVPIWLQRMNDAAAQGKKCMLFLDELNRAPIDVRQTALQLVLERQIHEHTLPVVNGCRTMIIAAINPVDSYQVDELDPALLDRFLHVNIEPDAKAWLTWARKSKVNGVVCDFISEYPDRIHYVPKDGGIGATPRSWTKLGAYMDNVHKIPEEILFQVMKGKIGSELGSQFFTFFKNYVDVVKIEDIVNLVNAHKDEVLTIEEIGDKIHTLMIKTEAIQKNDMALQMADKFMDEEDILPFLVYLYSLEVEICVAFLKGYRKDEPIKYKKLARVDSELNNKELFKRVVIAAEKE